MQRSIVIMKRRLFYASVLLVGLLALASPIAIRAFGVESFKIPAGSMSPTLLVGDRIFVSKSAFRSRAPSRGEMAVFRYPEHPDQEFVKRVVGVPGDEIEVRAGRLFINGWKVPSCSVGKTEVQGWEMKQSAEVVLEFLDDAAYLTLYTREGETMGPWTVKPNEYFVMGDNRDNSHDSRMWFGGEGGGVPRDLFVGRPALVWMGKDESGASRAGVKLGEPTLPASMSSLKAGFERCMRERPTRAQTSVPRKT